MCCVSLSGGVPAPLCSISAATDSFSPAFLTYLPTVTLLCTFDLSVSGCSLPQDHPLSWLCHGLCTFMPFAALLCWLLFTIIFSFISSLPPSLPGVFSIIIVFGTSLKNVIFKSLLTCRILLLLDAGLSEQKQSLCQPQHRAECNSSTWKYRHALIYCGEYNRRK